MGLTCITTCKLDALKSVCLPSTVSDSTASVNGDNSGSVTSHSELSSNEGISSDASGRSEAEKSCEENGNQATFMVFAWFSCLLRNVGLFLLGGKVRQ